MKKILVNFFVFILILSLVFQLSSASAISGTVATEPELQVISDSKIQLEPEGPEAFEQFAYHEPLLGPEFNFAENPYGTETPYAELLLHPDLPEDVHAQLLEQTEPVEKPEYTPPTPEQIAQTQAQVESFDCSVVTDVPQHECEVLVALYNSTNGAGWCRISNWLTGTTVDSWGGVTVTTGHVTELGLYNNCLSGILPPQIGDLVFLEGANFHNGGLSGNIPQDITRLINLKTLGLGDNLFSGPLPAFLGELPSLVSLGLTDNSFTGSIPPEFGNLSNLETLILSENDLSGSIPVELSNLSKLRWLFLDTNNLSGSIPVEMGNLSLLQSLKLFRNGLSGNIPASLGNLSELENLHLYQTNLSGTLPLAFINLTKLGQFYFYDTSLCEPTTPEFVAWKATVWYWSGTGIMCEDLPGLITGIEINQALGVQKNKEQNYVAGKDTIIRVLLDDPILVNSSTQSIIVKRGSTVVATLSPNKKPSSANSIDFYLPSDLTNCLDCNDTETYTFTANIDGQTISKTVDFHKTDKIRILVRPVTLVFDTYEQSLTTDEWKHAYHFLQQTYPVTRGEVEWVIGSPIRSSVNSLIDSELNSLLIQLNMGRGFCNSSFFAMVCRDAHIAIMPPLKIPSGGGYMEGVNNGFGSIVVFANGSYPEEGGTTPPPIDYMQAIVAHEMGHSYGLGDEYNIQGASFACSVNPPPEEYYDCGQIEQPEPWPGPGTGSLIPASDHPFETYGRGLLGDKLSFMGSGEYQEDYWISTDAYSKLFSELKKNSLLNKTQINEIGRLILISGWIGQDDSLRLEPWLHGNGTLPETGVGDYSIEAQDSGGTVLSTQFFDISFTDLSNPPRVLDEALFSVSMAYPEGTVRFVIKHGATVIGTRQVASTYPSVSLTSPNGGEVWDSETKQVVTWEGLTDGSVFYTLLYAPDGITYDVVAVNLTTNSYEVDPAYLVGGENASFKIFATDGVNTVEDTSDNTFSVLPKPPDAYLHYPQDGGVIPFGLSIILDGSGYDLEDGIITDENISWSSNIDGYLGNGANLLVDLSYGYHTLTLEVQDSDGNTSQKSISVFIGSKIYLPSVIR